MKMVQVKGLLVIPNSSYDHFSKVMVNLNVNYVNLNTQRIYYQHGYMQLEMVVHTGTLR